LFIFFRYLVFLYIAILCDSGLFPFFLCIFLPFVAEEEGLGLFFLQGEKTKKKENNRQLADVFYSLFPLGLLNTAWHVLCVCWEDPQREKKRLE